MSRWTHAICAKCWNKRGLGRQVTEGLSAFQSDPQCCFCGEVTGDGIFLRSDSNETGCSVSAGGGDDEHHVFVGRTA